MSANGTDVILKLLLFAQIIFAQTSYLDSLKAKIDTTVMASFSNTAFQSGEELNFKVRWKKSFVSIPAGYADMKVLKDSVINGRNCFHIKVTARSTSFIENFYEVRDTIETFIDKEYGFSWKFKKITREGNYFRDLYIDYDHVNEKANIREIRYKDDTLKKLKYDRKYTAKIFPFTQDILSSFYVMRARKIESGYPFLIPNNSRKKNYMLNVFVNPIEKEKVDAGKFKTFRLSPQIKGESIFNQKGAMEVWVTSDETHMPIQMKSEVKIGAVTVELLKYKGVNR